MKKKWTVVEFTGVYKGEDDEWVVDDSIERGEVDLPEKWSSVDVYWALWDAGFLSRTAKPESVDVEHVGPGNIEVVDAYSKRPLFGLKVDF